MVDSMNTAFDWSISTRPHNLVWVAATQRISVSEMGNKRRLERVVAKVELPLINRGTHVRKVQPRLTEAPASIAKADEDIWYIIICKIAQWAVVFFARWGDVVGPGVKTVVIGQ